MVYFDQQAANLQINCFLQHKLFGTTHKPKEH